MEVIVYTTQTLWNSSLRFMSGTVPVSYTHLDVYKRQLARQREKITATA